jgi:hypothetical protein
MTTTVGEHFAQAWSSSSDLPVQEAGGAGRDRATVQAGDTTASLPTLRLVAPFGTARSTVG